MQIPGPMPLAERKSGVFRHTLPHIPHTDGRLRLMPRG
jgi:hypothetical protein